MDETSEHQEEVGLEKACRVGDLGAIERALRRYPDSLNAVDGKGWTPLYRCTVCGHSAAVQLLLLEGADPNTQNALGDSALHQAAESLQFESAQFLLEANADPNLQNRDGETPMHKASAKDNKEMVKLLLNFKADTTLVTKTGLKPADLCRSADVRTLCATGNSTKSSQQSPLIDPMTDPIEEIPPIPQKSFEHLSLSAHSSRRNSEAFPDIHITEKSQTTTPKRIETNRSSSFEPDAEKADTSLRLQTQERGVSSGINPERKQALVQWLRQMRLEGLTGVLIDAGFDDLDQLLAQTKRQPISVDQLLKIGVKQKGHALRLLAAMELEQEFSEAKNRVSEKPKARSWSCCTAPTSGTGLSTYPPLQNWLEDLSLPQLLPNFVETGFEELEPMLMVMRTSYAFTDSLLQDDLHIEKPGHRHRILSKLREDSAAYDSWVPYRRMMSRIRMEKAEDSVPCEFCSLM